ncbi:response regulator [Uliginosibacterium sediminicola]|uniref:Response regulator n=1 Tax=Uliginosibacterium sediminicola TaxID=2024550 RepID=A0ABU9YV20_9RHOO
MNLDFGILWIEDSFSPAEEESLRRRVRDAGFIARIDAIPNGETIEGLAKEHHLYHRYDIILLDYRLRDERGDELAPKIRRLFPSTTILFYSGSVKEEGELRRLIASSDVEGVYCCRRDGQRFIQRTGELIDQTARALDRLSGMRGLAMRVVAECDEIMKKAMISMCGFDQGCKDKMPDLDADVFKSIDSMRQSYSDATVNSSDLIARLGTMAVDSAKLFAHFRRLTDLAVKNPSSFKLDEAQVDRLRELRRNSASYVDNVLRKRNVLAHVFEERGESGWVLKGKGSDEISVSDFPDIRRGFAGYMDALREIGTLVTASSSD